MTSEPSHAPLRPRVIVFALLGAGLLIALFTLPVRQYLGDFLAWTQSLGVAGPIVAGASYILAAIFLIPGSVLTLGTGFAFGLLAGTIAVSIGATLGAGAAFLLGRTMLRDAVEARVQKNPRFAAIEEAIAGQGFKIVLLTRLSPIFPYNFLNYAFSVTKVSFRDYFLASWIGMLPGTLMYVYLGSVAGDLAAIVAGETEGGLAQTLLLVVGLIATILVTVLITRIARRALAQRTRIDSVDETAA